MRYWYASITLWCQNMSKWAFGISNALAITIWDTYRKLLRNISRVEALTIYQLEASLDWGLLTWMLQTTIRLEQYHTNKGQWSRQGSRVYPTSWSCSHQRGKQHYRVILCVSSSSLFAPYRAGSPAPGRIFPLSFGCCCSTTNSSTPCHLYPVQQSWRYEVTSSIGQLNWLIYVLAIFSFWNRSYSTMIHPRLVWPFHQEEHEYISVQTTDDRQGSSHCWYEWRLE